MKEKETITKHPYFVSAILEELKQETDPAKRRKLTERLAANVGDEEALRRLAGNGVMESMDDFYPDLAPVHAGTEETIDAFIEKFGGGSNSTTEQLLPEESAPQDYFAALEYEEDSVEDIDEDEDFIFDELSGKEEEQSGSLTLEFAKIMIKNGNYSKALEIIRDIYLNNREKSIYFADQIRFIKKLMLNDSKKKQNL